MSEVNELKIDKIKNGTVLDNLPAGTAPMVLHILGIDSKWESAVAVAMNVPSKRSGKKDMVKIESMILKKEETDKLGLIANNATINLIKNYKVLEKHHVSMPKELSGMLTCSNPFCVTNKGEPIVTRFVVESDNPLRLRCKFCERIMEKELIEEQL